jgi:hypothetical protein
LPYPSPLFPIIPGNSKISLSERSLPYNSRSHIDLYNKIDYIHDNKLTPKRGFICTLLMLKNAPDVALVLPNVLQKLFRLAMFIPLPMLVLTVEHVLPSVPWTLSARVNSQTEVLGLVTTAVAASLFLIPSS